MESRITLPIMTVMSSIQQERDSTQERTIYATFKGFSRQAASHGPRIAHFSIHTSHNLMARLWILQFSHYPTLGRGMGRRVTGSGAVTGAQSAQEMPRRPSAAHQTPERVVQQGHGAAVPVHSGLGGPGSGLSGLWARRQAPQAPTSCRAMTASTTASFTASLALHH